MDYDRPISFFFFYVKTQKLHSSHFEVLKQNFQLDILKTMKYKFYFETLWYNTKWNLANTMKQNRKKWTSYKNEDQFSSDILTLPKFVISTCYQKGGDKGSEKLSGKKSMPLLYMLTVISWTDLLKIMSPSSQHNIWTLVKLHYQFIPQFIYLLCRQSHEANWSHLQSTVETMWQKQKGKETYSQNYPSCESRQHIVLQITTDVSQEQV
jgi:hypothetical protein